MVSASGSLRALWALWGVGIGWAVYLVGAAAFLARQGEAVGTEYPRQLFAAKGFEATTTRDIADAAGIASGTLFNYFATKEAILASLAVEALALAHRESDGDTDAASTFEEDLFALVAAGLRALRPLRKHLCVLVATALSPLVAAQADADHSPVPSVPSAPAAARETVRQTLR
jgi:AcrR family transcriptional regulator